MHRGVPHGQMNRKEVISFRKTIPAGTQNMILQEMIKADGTVEKVAVRFYQGQQKALQVIPYIDHKGDQREDLITYPKNTDHYLSGDDDYLIYDVVSTVEYLDYASVMVTNTDPTYDYTLAVDITVDYYGGKDRVV